MIQSCVRSILTLLVLPLLVLPMLLSSAAGAADLRIRVITPDGEPVANAVVSVPGELTAVALRAEPLEMAQVDIQFDPFVLVVPRGADVVFPNRDRVRHHVYSFARGNRFELELYGREQERSVRFDVAGPVPLGCNIHDQMIAFIRVVDTPFAARTDADGRAVLAGLPAGSTTLTVWHPYGNAEDNVVTLAIDPAGGTEATVTLALLGQN